MKQFLLFSIVLLIPMFGLGQGISTPQLPQPSTFQPVLPQLNVTPHQTNVPVQQSKDHLLQGALADQARVEKERREHQQDMAEINSDIRLLEEKRQIHALLDTTFGKPPVIDKQQYEATKLFWDALVVLTDMQQGKRPFSITEAIYYIENAYYKGGLKKEVFTQAIEARADLCKQIMQREKLNTENNIAKNYAIQKLYQQENLYKNPQTGKTIKVQRLQYDFTDFMGDSSHTQMFVSKLLTTGKGQCHSMPLLYLCIAEQLGAKANLSLAPEHSFIRFADDEDGLYNFETTNGRIVTDKWLLQSGYITSTAIRNKIYLDTLSEKQLLSLCILDLIMGYQYDNGYDGFTETALKYALQLYPMGIQQHIMFSNFWAMKMFRAIKYYGISSADAMSNYPVASALQKRMLREYEIIDGLGYQQMPKEAYQKWLQSVDEQKEKQDQEKLQKEITHQLKKGRTKTTLHNQNQ